MVYMDIFYFLICPPPLITTLSTTILFGWGGGLFEGEDVAKHFGQGAEFFERVGANPR